MTAGRARFRLPELKCAMRKIIVYLATSADGYIARPDGDVGWLEHPRPAGNYGFGAFYKSIDTVLMGRITYEVGRKLGQEGYSGKKNYVFSHARQPKSRKVEFIHEDVSEFARGLRNTDASFASLFLVLSRRSRRPALRYTIAG